MPPVPTSKRSACDRCRIQKLRCPPSVDGTEACTRCTRLGAQCITSYPRPSNGAPQSVSHAQGQPELRPKVTNALPSPAATVTTGHTISRSNTIASEPMNTSPSHRASNSVSTISTPFDPLSFALDDNFDYFSGQSGTLQLDGLGFLTNDSTSALFTNDAAGFPPLSLSGMDGGGSSVDLSDASGEMQHSGSDIFSNDQQYNILEYNPRLSSLNLDLSKRLEQCLGSASEDTAMLENQASGTDNSASSRGINSIFEHALGDLSEFLIIIQSYTSKKNGNSPGNSTADLTGQGFLSGSGTSAGHRISIVVFLNLISAYLQIIVIYDKIFRSLSARLFAGSPDANSGGTTQRAAGLRLTGLSVSHGNLQTKILIHAILHQFDLIERMLGLPADLRVTDKPGVYLGLFEDDRARGLLGAVSNGNRIENNWGPGQINLDDHRSSKALSSLRETIKMVQVFLDM